MFLFQWIYLGCKSVLRMMMDTSVSFLFYYLLLNMAFFPLSAHIYMLFPPRGVVSLNLHRSDLGHTGLIPVTIIESVLL